MSKSFEKIEEENLKLEHFPTKERLHSDVLEDKYGPIRSRIIRHDNVSEKHKPGEEYIREAHLEDESGISRTYALTFLEYDKSNSEILGIDKKIREGGMIGKTFREHKYEIRKNVIDVFTLLIPDWLKKDFATNENFAKARVSEFYAKKKDHEPVIYGDVLEVYSPDFRGPTINKVDIAQINPMTEMFEHTGVSKEKIWSRLGEASKEDEWSDLEDKFEEAKKESLPIVFDLRKKIQNFLESKQD